MYSHFDEYSDHSPQGPPPASLLEHRPIRNCRCHRQRDLISVFNEAHVVFYHLRLLMWLHTYRMYARWGSGEGYAR